MEYFDDIEFLDGGFCDAYKCHIKRNKLKSCSFEFIREGRVYCSIDGKARFVMEGPCAFWHHDKSFYDYGPADERGWKHHWLLLRGERVKRALELGLMKRFPEGFAKVKEPELFDAQFHEILDKIWKGGRSARPEAAALFELMIAQLFRWNDDAAEKENPSRAPFQLLADALAQAPNENPDFEKIARSWSMSYANFRRLFKKRVGKAPREFLLDCRMRQAALKLRSAGAELQIKELAWRCGYKDPAQFSKLFKIRFGMSPQEYKERFSPTDRL